MLDAVIDWLKSLLDEVREFRREVSRGRDRRDKDPFLKFGSATLPPGGAPTLILRELVVPGKVAECMSLANTLDTANAWDDGTGATGAFFQVRVGSRTLPRLGLMNSPYGLIGARQPIEVHFGLEQGPLEVWGVNFGAAEVVACAQVAGEHYSELPSRGDR